MVSEKERLRKSVYYPIGIVVLLWFVKGLEWIFAQDFGAMGILPRTLKGTKGILLSGFVHGDVLHLISNSIPLVLLGGAIVYFYYRNSLQIILVLYLLTGSLVWFFARSAYHIGASGLVYGMLSFLLLGGVIRKDRQTLAISFAVLVLYGGSMFSGVVPGDPRISWESHLMGFIVGILCAIYYRKSPLSIATIDSLSKEEASSEKTSDEFCSTTATKEQQTVTFRYHYRENSDTNE